MTPAVRARGLTRTFGHTRALGGVDLDVVKGTTLGIRGANGAGRSTLLQVLATLLAPDAGELMIAGIDAIRHPLHARTAAMYLADRLPGAAALRVREYLEFVRRARRARTRPVVEISVGAALERAALPTEAAVEQLPTGLRRQLGLTAALLAAPPLLLLDDPFAGLDPAARDRFAAWLSEWRHGGTTIVMAANTDEDAALCDACVSLAAGTVTSYAAVTSTAAAGARGSMVG